jgi:hypothetical protein
MLIVRELINGWPKLAWVALCRRNHDKVIVYHGPCVETRANWCVEGVWDGDFDAGGFDQTDLMFGTGIHCRRDNIVFVTPSTTLDRLWHYHTDEFWYVSNSLPAILATVKLDLIDEYNYPSALISIYRGLNSFVRTIPTTGGDLHVTYFHNLLFDGKSLTEVPKPNLAPPFQMFHDYRTFLLQTSEHLAENYRSPGRQFRIEPMVALSQGYDSSMAAVIARHGGCELAATVQDARAFVLHRSDSGETIAKYLGLCCQCYARNREAYPYEESIWAMGDCGDLNLTVFDYPAPLCLLFTGFHGDFVWDRARHDLSQPLVRHDAGGSGFTEFRLSMGVFNCPVPFWGIQRAQEIQALSFAAEMAPWTLHNTYDRPIPRRILEEAGVPRGTFAVRKNASSFHDQRFPWPFSPCLREDFAAYLKTYGYSLPQSWEVRLSPLFQFFDNAVIRRMPIGRKLRCSPWLRLPASWLFFRWANDRLVHMYAQAQNEALGS